MLLLYVWSAAKIYRTVVVTIIFPVFTVTLFKQWIHLFVPLDEHNKHQLSLIFIKNMTFLHICHYLFVNLSSISILM